MATTALLTLVTFFVAAIAQQQPRLAPDVSAQRQAMKKLGFLTGNWVGHGRMLRASGDWIEFDQTERVVYKLDGLLLVIEGVGSSKSDGRPALQAYGIVSFDDATGKYHMRAFNDGRWLETEMILSADGKALAWGFTLGDIRTHSTLQVSDAGEWTESHEITVGTQPSRKFMELTVKPVHGK